MVKKKKKVLLPILEMWVQSLAWEDPLEKEMATLFSILAWEIPWTEEPGGLQSIGSQKVREILATKQLHVHTYIWINSLWMLKYLVL